VHNTYWNIYGELQSTHILTFVYIKLASSSCRKFSLAVFPLKITESCTTQTGNTRW